MSESKVDYLFSGRMEQAIQLTDFARRKMVGKLILESVGPEGMTLDRVASIHKSMLEEINKLVPGFNPGEPGVMREGIPQSAKDMMAAAVGKKTTGLDDGKKAGVIATAMTEIFRHKPFESLNEHVAAVVGGQMAKEMGLKMSRIPAGELIEGLQHASTGRMQSLEKSLLKVLEESPDAKASLETNQQNDAGVGGSNIVLDKALDRIAKMQAEDDAEMKSKQNKDMDGPR